MTSEDIKRILANKHLDDIVVHEAPTGPSYGAKYGQIDTWVLKTSWSKATVTGYEIKVSRQDFLKDDKWPMYLPYCNEFYFVTKHGVVKNIGEIPEDAGWYEVSKTGERLFTRKKAKYRTEDLKLSQIMRAVLMNRAVIKRRGRNSEIELTREQRIAEWRDLVDSGKEVGYHVRGRITEEMQKLRSENSKLLAESAKIEKFKEILRENGLDPNLGTFAFELKVKNMVKPTADMDDLVNTRNSLLRIKAMLDGTIGSLDYKIDKGGKQ